MLNLFPKWFVQSELSQDYGWREYIVLATIFGVGAFLRFWGLANVGLHGDEETMAMPAMAILESGQPYLPSGMYYARALINLYLMSGSVWLFGESEWAFRLPSAVVGSLTGVVAFYMGRRFLGPQTNIAFVATIVFLPSMIEVSQTARMYVFFVTCMIWFAACIFRWERNGTTIALILALIVWMLALHFHILAIFAAPLFFWPGLTRQSWPSLLKGAVAASVGLISFQLYRDWIAGKYPDSSQRPEVPDGDAVAWPLDVLASYSEWLVPLSLFVIVGLMVQMALVVRQRGDWSQILPVLVCGAGLVGIVTLNYHLGGLLLLFGVVFWLRADDLPKFWLAAVIAIAGAVALLHLGLLYKSGEFPGRKLIGAVVGSPSVWPTLRFLVYSPIAGIVYAGAAALMLVQFARGRRLPMHFLFFCVVVWAPLLALGFVVWNIPPRYAQGQIGYFLVCAFAGLTYLMHRVSWLRNSASAYHRVVILALACVVLVNPMMLSKTINAGYERHPDHKGAAEYIRSLGLSDDAVLIAEDSLQQAYYLGSVDYWLRQIDDVAIYAFVRDGRLIDQYTGAHVIGTGQELTEVLNEHRDKDIYIIGSGENFVSGKRLFRGRGIDNVLTSERTQVVFTGRDGKTQIWSVLR